jgi:maltose/moltooligosaccharide transporter
MGTKKRLSFWDIWNMSFGFLGIQFGFALQGSNMSRIFQTLGADKDDIPILWIAAPLTGLIVQPIIGYMSDRTWSPRWGRRRPFFLIGAVLSSLALFFVPYSPAVWMAAGFLWVLDASINISMEPFRALVADKLPDDQRSYGFVIQTLIIGIGTWVASNLPWLVTKLGAENTAAAGEIPQSVYVAFAVGAFVFMASILYTVFTTTEEPPEDMEAFEKEKSETAGFFNGLNAIARNVSSMPLVMKKLGLVQFFSWFAFFTMWSFATPALTESVFNAPQPEEGAANYEQLSAAYNNAANLVSSSMGVYGLTSMAFALIIAFFASRIRVNRKYIHMVSLIIGGIGFISMMHWTPETSWGLNLSFALVGIAWGSILSMPYAMVSSALPAEKMGVYMGIFNMFIVIPQIVASLGGINILYKNLLGEDIINTMVLAGICLILGGLTNLTIVNKQAIS